MRALFLLLFLTGCAGRTEIDSDELASVECAPTTYAAPGAWLSGDGDTTRLPNFVARADGSQWLFPFVLPPTGVVASVTVMVSQFGLSPPIHTANMTVSQYDNGYGWAEVGPVVRDDPSTKKHPIIVEGPFDIWPTETTRAVIQAPLADEPDASGLWVWSVPLITTICR